VESKNVAKNVARDKETIKEAIYLSDSPDSPSSPAAGSSDTISVRLPGEVVKLVDLGVSKGVWESRGEAVRCLALAGIGTSTVKKLGIDVNPSMAHGMELLSELSWEKSIQQGVQVSLARLEPTLATALRGGPSGADEAVRMLGRIKTATDQMPGFWKDMVKNFMKSSAVFRLASERYGEVEEWKGAP